MDSKNPLNTAMVLTPPSSAAIAVVRLRGPGVAGFLGKNFSKKVEPGKCVHGELRDRQTVLDDPVVMLADGSAWADVSLHGGAWIVRSVLDLAQREGFSIRSAALPLPDEFLDETDSRLQREMLAHLPLARTDLAIRTLLAQPAAWQSAPLDLDTIAKDFSLWWLLNPPQIAIVGEPNVGKSTLANQLFGQERSITADLPGTTRDWVGEIADIDGLAVILVDTPGQRQTDDPIEQAAIAASSDKIRRSDLVLEIIDATRKPRSLLAHSMTVINKIDQTPAWDIASIPAVRISAKTGDGLVELRRKIREHFGLGQDYQPAARWWTLEQWKILASRDARMIKDRFGLA